MNNTFAGYMKSVDSTGGFEAVISSLNTDRDNESFDPGAFLPLPASVPVHLGHGGELVGSGKPEYRGNHLYLKGRFASTPKAQEARTLAKEGHLASMSIVFKPTSHRYKDGSRIFTRAELLAADLVTIPANPDARLVMARGFNPQPKSYAQARAQAELVLAEVTLVLNDDRGPARKYADQLLRSVR